MSKIALLMLLVSPALAAPTRTKAPQAARPQHYDFDDDVVEGGAMQPDGSLVDTRRPIKHSTLIKIRETFLPELVKSAEDL